jgi:hypothetical protein
MRSDSSLVASLVPPAKNSKAAKKKLMTLPQMLTNASIKDVVLEEVIDKISMKSIQVGGGKLVTTTKSIHGIHFNTIKVDQICMSTTRDELCLLIAQNQMLLTIVYEAQDVKAKA